MDHNRSFAEQFEAGNLAIRPKMSTIILTCVDARVDPAHIFGLGLGDAVVMRNNGMRVESLPVSFEGPNGAGIEARSGQELTAY